DGDVAVDEAAGIVVVVVDRVAVENHGAGDVAAVLDEPGGAAGVVSERAGPQQRIGAHLDGEGACIDDDVAVADGPGDDGELVRAHFREGLAGEVQRGAAAGHVEALRTSDGGVVVQRD